VAPRFFSAKKRPVHLGPFKLETLPRQGTEDLAHLLPFKPLDYRRDSDPASILNAMRDHAAMLDAIRDGLVNKARAGIPDDPAERANHLKAFGYFADASMVGTCALPADAVLTDPCRNPDIDRLADWLRTKQTKTLASGIDVIMADLKESMEAPPTSIESHNRAIVFLYAHPRAPRAGEPGCDWIQDALPHRSSLLASETAVVIANYIRLLGYSARAQTGSSSDVHLGKLAVAAGLAVEKGGVAKAPYLGDQFGVAAITTDFDIAVDAPLAESAVTTTVARYRPKYDKRRFLDGALPFEKLKRVDKPTTYLDEPNIPRVPKRTDMFSRAQFGDMGKAPQDGAAGGKYARKSAPSTAQRRALGAFVLLQDGEPATKQQTVDPQAAHDLVTATAYFLGADAVGVSRCPDWAWYSHNAAAEPVNPPHDNAVSLIIDQGFDTMEGASGDDWISVAQSMRAYLRFSLLGGVLSQQLRNLGYKAKAHTVLDGDVLQPPLLLLSGLGEVSRIGEVILNPYLGPRLKSGVVTTDLPMTHDKPIDFGLQPFCEACKKCARECPSGAITAGPKLMFNGYEIWKSDSQRCATYRITTPGGAMCGRCMKTCPWNLEGILADEAFRWAAMNVPSAAPALARLDDALDRGALNPAKKWWWDIEMEEDGGYRPSKHPVNARGLQKDLDLKYEDQTLAVYPAPLVPHPYPYPFHMDREKGIEAYQEMITAEAYRDKLARGETDMLHHVPDFADSPVQRVQITKAEVMADGVTKYEMQSLDGSDLPEWEAGAHLDIVVAPEYLRQYSMSGDPADRSTYQIGVLKEEAGRGGSALLHRIFNEGRKVFISRPINHFPLHEDASFTYLMGGGIGITPMIAMAHRLHAINAPFELHYSGRTRDTMGYLEDLSAMPWADRVTLHVSAEGTRADLGNLFSHQPGAHVYTCGGEAYMAAIMDAAARAGFDEDNCHLEYFSVPEAPDYENHPFTMKLSKSGKVLEVPDDKSVADVLVENGVPVDIKCSDGLCGVCKCDVISGEIEHRDFVLSKAQQGTAMITCQSRAAKPGGEIELDL
jgi:reductive dehalogenase